MIEIPVCDTQAIVAAGYRQLSIVPLPRPDVRDTTVRGDTRARIAALTMLGEHYQCDIAYLANVCAPIAMTPEGHLFIKDE